MKGRFYWHPRGWHLRYVRVGLPDGASVGLLEIGPYRRFWKYKENTQGGH